MMQKIASSCTIKLITFESTELQDPEPLAWITIYSLLFGLFQFMMKNSSNPVLLLVIQSNGPVSHPKQTYFATYEFEGLFLRNLKNPKPQKIQQL